MFDRKDGVLRAGGASVHRIAQRPGTAPAPQEDKPQFDREAVIERYQEIAVLIHRVTMVPLRDRFLCGCTCGWTALSPATGSRRASMILAQHVSDETDNLFEKYEGRKITEIEGLNESD